LSNKRKTEGDGIDISDVFAFVGLTAFTVGVGFVHVPSGVIVFGAALFIMGIVKHLKS